MCSWHCRTDVSAKKLSTLLVVPQQLQPFTLKSLILASSPTQWALTDPMTLQKLLIDFVCKRAAHAGLTVLHPNPRFNAFSQYALVLTWSNELLATLEHCEDFDMGN